MFITKKHLSRRTFLNGVGVTMALPLLESMLPAATATEKLLTYALGRRVEYYDMPAVRAVVRDAARTDYRFSSLIVGIVKSVPFGMRRNEGEP